MFFSCTAVSQAGEDSDEFEAYISRYLQYHWETHPEEATARGIHSVDSRLAPMSREDFLSRSTTLQQFLQALEKFKRADLSIEQQVDVQLLRSDMLIRQADIEKLRQWERDPTMYIPFDGLNDLMTGEFAAVEQRMQALLARLQQVPRVLKEGRQNLREPPRLFTETAIDTAERLLPFYDISIPEFASQVPALETRIKTAAKAARAALLDYIRFLKMELLPRSGGSIAIGRENYDFYLKEWHMLDDDVDSLLKKGEQYFRETEQLLIQAAEQIDPGKTWQEITADLRKHHPGSDTLLDTYCSEIQRAKQHVIRQGLVSVPAREQVRCFYTPPSQRAFTPFGDFRQPPPFSRNKVGKLILHPIDSSLSSAEQEKMLQAHDYTWISVISPHESYPGHHLQALKAQQNPRPFRKVYDSPVFSEGWGLYCEELMYETGFFRKPKLTRLTQLRLRLWRAARIILDTKLHSGQMSYDEARQFLADKVGFEPGSTAGEVNIYVFHPSYVISYMIGFNQIIKLRKEYRQRKGSRFTLRDFHDRLLTQGAMPFRLIRKLLFSE